MNDDISNYLHKHTAFVTFIVISVFIILAVGEYGLYRKMNNLNKMVSEGLMQMKEQQKTNDMMWEEQTDSTPSAKPSQGDTMMRDY